MSEQSHRVPSGVLFEVSRVVGTEFPGLDRIEALLTLLHVRGVIRWSDADSLPPRPPAPRSGPDPTVPEKSTRRFEGGQQAP